MSDQNPRTGNDASLMLRLPASLKARLVRVAHDNGRTLSSEVNSRLSASLSAAQNDHSPTVHVGSTAKLVTYEEAALLDSYRALAEDTRAAMRVVMLAATAGATNPR